MKGIQRKPTGLAITKMLGIVLCGCVPMSVSAAPTGAANAYDLTVAISVVGVGVLNVSPQAQVQHTPQLAAWSDSVSFVSYDSGPGALRLSTGALNATSEWIPGAVFHAIGSQSTVDNLDLNVTGLLSVSLLTLQAQQVRATAIIVGSCPAPPTINRPVSPDLVDGYVFANGFDNGALRPTGTTETPGLGGSITGISLGTLPALPPPNTAVNLGALGIVGATLILNEQVIGGDGINSSSISNNAVHLTLNVAGVVTANVIIAHADAAIVCS